MKQMPTVEEPVTASMVCHVTVHLPCQHVCALRLRPVSLQSKYIVSTRTKISVGSLAYRDYNNYETDYLLPSSDSETFNSDGYFCL